VWVSVAIDISGDLVFSTVSYGQPLSKLLAKLASHVLASRLNSSCISLIGYRDGWGNRMAVGITLLVSGPGVASTCSAANSLGLISGSYYGISCCVTSVAHSSIADRSACAYASNVSRGVSGSGVVSPACSIRALGLVGTWARGSMVGVSCIMIICLVAGFCIWRCALHTLLSLGGLSFTRTGQ
jgi:hypothetical protein